MGVRITALGAASALLLAIAGPLPAAESSGGGPAPAALELERGMPLADALERLRAHGLRVVYSDMLVRPGYTLRSELRGGSPEQLARKALEPWGLDLRSLEGGMVAVVSVRTPRWQLQGRVVAAPDGAPIEGARVELLGGAFVAWTDGEGRFTLRGPVGGMMQLRVSAGGYASARSRFASEPGDLPALVVALDPAAPELGEVTVVASRFEIGSEDDGAFVLDQASFYAQPKNGEDALQATQRLPGVAFSGYSGRPNVRGGEAGEMMVLLDGMPIREAFHLADFNSAFSAIDEQMVARLTSYSGTMPARYANRLAAAIDLESVDTSPATPNVIGLSSFNARLQLRGAAGREQPGTGWLAVLRKGTLGGLLEQAVPDLGRPDSTDGFFKLASRDAAGNEIGARGLLARSTFSYTDDETGEWARLRGDASYLWVTAARSLGGVRLSALLGHSWIDSRREGQLIGGLTPSGQLDDERSARLWDLQLRAEGLEGSRHLLQGGLSYAAGRGTYDYRAQVDYDASAERLFGLPDSRARDVHATAERDLLGLHVEDRWQLGEALWLELGARLDRAFTSGSSGSTYFSPRLSLRWSPSAATAWRIGWSRAHQLPEAHELRVEDGEILLPGAQRMDQAVASLEHHFRSGLVLRAEIYDRRMPRSRVRYENVLDQLRLLPDLAADRIRVVPERSLAQGAEISALWERGGWMAWGAYSWSRVRDRIDGAWIDRAWDQRHALHLSTAWRSGPWTLGGELALRGGRPATGFADQTLLTGELGPRAADRYPGYFSLDLRVARRFSLGEGQLNVFFQLTNALNQQNRCCTEIDLPDEDSDPLLFEVQPRPSCPWVPALGFQYEF